MKPHRPHRPFLPNDVSPVTAVAGVPSPRRGGRAPRSRGFSLPELAVTVALVAVLAAIAQALLAGTVHAARAADARSALLDTYRTAIGHAATRGVHVVACPARGDACIDGIDWSGGWLLFVDGDGDREHDAGERVVSSFPPLGTRVHLRSTVGRTRLVFQPSGGNAGSNVTFTLCDGRGADEATQLVIANDGRLRQSPAPAAAAARCVADS